MSQNQPEPNSRSFIQDVEGTQTSRQSESSNPISKSFRSSMSEYTKPIEEEKTLTMNLTIEIEGEKNSAKFHGVSKYVE